MLTPTEKVADGVESGVTPDEERLGEPPMRLEPPR